jgi:hypothetical protein
MSNEQHAKWQPVMLIANRRLECKCGALAIFVTGTLEDDDVYTDLTQVDVWCQSCFEKAQADV